MEAKDSLPEKLRERVFEKIFSVAEISKLSYEEYLQYISSLKVYRDNKNSLDTARDEGEAKGRAEGEQLKTIEIAKKLKKDNIPIELIVKYTNLTIEEIEKL